MTTTVNINKSAYTAVSSAIDGPAIVTAASIGGAYFRIQKTQPLVTDVGHFVEQNETIEIAQSLSSGCSLWMRSVQIDGLVIKTLDSEV